MSETSFWKGGWFEHKRGVWNKNNLRSSRSERGVRDYRHIDNSIVESERCLGVLGLESSLVEFAEEVWANRSGLEIIYTPVMLSGLRRGGWKSKIDENICRFFFSGWIGIGRSALCGTSAMEDGKSRQKISGVILPFRCLERSTKHKLVLKWSVGSRQILRIVEKMYLGNNVSLFMPFLFLYFLYGG